MLLLNDHIKNVKWSISAVVKEIRNTGTLTKRLLRSNTDAQLCMPSYVLHFTLQCSIIM